MANTIENGYLEGCSGCGSTYESMEVKKCKECGTTFCEVCAKPGRTQYDPKHMCPSCNKSTSCSYVGITKVKY